MNFVGFSVPEGSYFPPELRAILPGIDTLSELKVLLCVLDAYFQAGLDAQPLTHEEIRQRTGLSRYGANEGLKRGRTRGTLHRLSVGGGFAYEPVLKIRTPCHESSHDNHNHNTSHEDENMTCGSDPQQQRRLELRRILVEEFSVATRVADNIAMGRDPDYVMRHIEYARYELTRFEPRNIPGFIVARIRDDKAPPLGFGKEKPGNSKRWYTDEEYELYFEHSEEETDG